MEPPKFPMPVKEFLEREDVLKRSDVMLSRHKKALFSKLIMWGTKSLFSHAALVFVIPFKEEGFANTFIIESIGDGIDITNLDYYLVEHGEDYDVGFKRLESEWFSGKEGKNIRKAVRGRMLDFIKAKYDMGTNIQIAKMIIRKFIFGMSARIRGFPEAVERVHEKKQLVPSEFICSGFVAYGYFDEIERLVEKGKLTNNELEEVFFNSRLSLDMNEDERRKSLLSTTPNDIAVTDNLQWKYFIKQGMVYEVSSIEEVEALIKKK